MDAREVAAKLTEAQTEYVLRSGNCYADPNTVRSLRRKEVVRGLSLTPLGEAVRAHLLGEG